MRVCNLISFLLIGASAHAAAPVDGGYFLLSADPVTTYTRRLASLKQERPKPLTNDEALKLLPLGAIAMVQNSFKGWNNEIVTVIEHIEGGSVRVRMANGREPEVKFRNLARNLSPEVKCGKSGEVEVCKGEKVFYPSMSASLNLPEGEVIKVFHNNLAVIRDGGDMLVDLHRVGKSVECSPQKPNICVDKHVYADVYYDGGRHSFEGNVERAYSHGPVLIRQGVHLYPIDASAVRERLSRLEDDSAAITGRDFEPKVAPTHAPGGGRVQPELEPGNPNEADRVNEAR